MDESDSVVGRSYAFRLRFRSMTGLALADHGTQVSILTPDGAIHEIARDRLSSIAVDPPAPSSPAYRLWRESRHGDLRQGTILRHVEVLLRNSLPRRRAFAMSALDADDPGGIADAGLSATEQTWLLMWLHHNRGDWKQALHHLDRLPAENYPDKVGVLAACWPRLADSPGARQFLQERVAQLAGPLPELLRQMASGASPGPMEHALRTLSAAPPRGVRFDKDAWRRTVRTCELLSPVDRADAGAAAALAPPLATVHHALTHGSWPGDTVPSSEVLLGLPMPALDDLIDGALVPKAVVDAARAATHPAADYLAARLIPHELSKDQLAAAGHDAEAARRTYLEGGDWTTSPAEDEPYRALLGGLSRFRDGDATAEAHVSPLLPTHLRPVAAAVAASLNTGVIDPAALEDRSTWPVLAPLLPTGGDVRTAPEPVQRLHQWRSLHEAKEALFAWDWDTAIAAARECLRTAVNEDVRDEALNLLAAGLFQQGSDAAAEAALREALQGQDSPDLIVNYGVVAAECDLVGASLELARLAFEAPSLELRVTAAKRALVLWDAAPPGEEGDEPPEALILAMRSLAVEPTDLEEHTSIMRFLSWADAEWLAVWGHTQASPYAGTVQHRYFVSRANGAKQAVEELARHHAARTDDGWVAEETQRLADEIIGILLDSGSHLGAALWALELSDVQVPLTDRQRVLVPVLGVREFAYDLLEDEDRSATLKRELFARVEQASAVISRLDDPEPYRKLIEQTAATYGAACWPGWASNHDAAVDAYNSLLGRLAGLRRGQVDLYRLRQATAPVVEMLNELERDVAAVRAFVREPEMVSSLDDLRNHAAELRRSILELQR